MVALAFAAIAAPTAPAATIAVLHQYHARRALSSTLSTENIAQDAVFGLRYFISPIRPPLVVQAFSKPMLRSASPMTVLRTPDLQVTITFLSVGILASFSSGMRWSALGTCFSHSFLSGQQRCGSRDDGGEKEQPCAHPEAV